MGQAESKQELFWDACGFGRPHLVEKCIEHGIDVNWVSEVHSCSPIHVASQGKADIVKLLIEANCDLTAQDSRGNTAVHHAAMKGHADIVEILLSAGARIDVQDKNGWTPLHCAAYYAHLRVVEVLVKLKCDVNILNKDGRSALVELARSKEKREEKLLGEIARQLIEAGCDINLKCTDLGEANFSGLMFAAYHGHVDVATAYIDAGCNLNIQTLYTRWTALHWASDCDHTDMVYLLMEAGADPSIKGNRGELASDRAKDLEVKELLENAVKVLNHKDDTKSSESFSSEHFVNAQATLDAAKALENLSTHDKNRGILKADMPTFPPLGITARTDPKMRYTKRSVTEVATKSGGTAPWKNLSKHTSPSPDREGEGEERQKMFPSQDDKTNAFMDVLARRINYMTNRIHSMSEDGSREGSASRGDDSQSKTEKVCNGDGSDDSGLSSRNASQVASEINTPEDDLRMKDMQLNVIGKTSKANYPTSPKSPLSPDSASSGSPTKVVSPSKEKLNLVEDACLIEESRRGINILRALQERHRRSLILEESEAAELSKSISRAADRNGGVEGEAPALQSITTDI